MSEAPMPSIEFQTLFDAGAKLIEGRINLDGRDLPKPGFFEKRRLLKGLRLLARAAEVEPPYGAASLLAAKVEERLGNFQESLRWLRKAQGVAPDNLIVAIELGAALSRRGLHTEAVGALLDVARLYPDDARVHYNLGLSSLMSVETDTAVAAFRRAVALEPDRQMNKRLLALATDVLEGRKPCPRNESEIARSL